MQDVNGSAFILLAGPADWTAMTAMAWSGRSLTLAGQQSWRLPALARDAALAALHATAPVVMDADGATARLATDGLSVQASTDGVTWSTLSDLAGRPLAPKLGRFMAMSLGHGRLALIASDGATAMLHLFDLRERWALDDPQNPPLPLALDPAAIAVATAADGTIYATVLGGVAMVGGGPLPQVFTRPRAQFEPVAANPAPLRQLALIPNRPAQILAMAVDDQSVALLSDATGEPQILALLDRATGAWTDLPLTPADGTALPFITDIALLGDGLVALMAPIAPGGPNRDCAVVSVAGGSVTMAHNRYPMLDQSAPRFAAIPGPDVRYLPGTGLPRPLLPLPHPGFTTRGTIGCFGLRGGDADLVWHRLYVEAALPAGTTLTLWARAAERSVGSPDYGDVDQAGLLAALLALDPARTSLLAGDAPAGSPLASALADAPFHRQPKLALSPLTSELPFHPGLAAGSDHPGGLYELLLQRSAGANRRMEGASLDLVLVAAGDGRHTPCIRAIRVYSPRFCYQAAYLPNLFQQIAIPDEADQDPAIAAPDFRERMLASFEGMLTPIETRIASAEMLLDPYAAPVEALDWLASFLGRSLDPGWPAQRRRRAVAVAGHALRQRGTFRGVCTVLDVATDGAVARGEIVLVETHRLRRTAATILGIPLGGRNALTEDAVASGNSVVGDTLVLSAERARDVLALLAPSADTGADAATVSRVLDEYADRVQVAAILHGAAAALRPAVQAVLAAELPAQLQFEIITAERSFILGLAPLLGIDTFLEPAAPPAALTLDTSRVGRDAVVRDAPALLP